MAIIKKTLFADNLDKYNTFVTDTDPLSKYFKLTELSDTFTGGKNAFLIQGSEYLVADSLIKIELKDSKGDIIYHEPGEGIVSASVNGEPIVTEYYEGVSKVVSVYIYPDTAYGPCTITILGELASYDNNGINTPIPANWEGSYNVKWQKEINVVPSLANDTRIRFYRRPTASISEILNPIYSFVGDTKVASAVTQSFANIKLSNLETFAGDVKRVKVFRTSIGDISDYDLIQDILVESKELLTTDELTGSVVGNTGIFTSEVLKTQWNTGSLNAFLTSSRVEAGVRLTGSGLFTYTQSLDLKSTNTYELNLDVFYSSSIDSNLGIYLVSGSTSSSIATLAGTQPTKNLLDTTIPFKIDRDYPTASLYFSQSQGEWHLGNISLKLSEDTAFSPDEIGFITTMPTVLGNETFNFKFEFYDVNNNYVPVAVTQSATFTGGNTNIGGTITLINSSSAVLSSSINTLSASVSTSVQSLTGSITDKSSSFNNSVILLTGSITTVSASVNTLSSSVSQSISSSLSSSLLKVRQLADGTLGYNGTFIDGTTVFSPVIGGVDGYFSGKFQVGAAPNPIVLDAQTSTRKIYIGTGTYGNSNTSVYLDSTGKFSLGNKLTYDGTNLSVNGTITITNPSTANNGGKVGGFDNGDAITGGSIAGVTIASTKIYIGTGTFANANTGFYVDSSGQFSLKDKLYWDGTTLNIVGNLNVGSSVPSSAVSGLGSLATRNSVSKDDGVTGLGGLAIKNSVGSGEIDTNAVTEGKIATDAVTSGKIFAGAVIAGKIAANAVTANEIAANTITAGKIAANTITATQIAAGAITANEIAATTITGANIAAGAITAGKISVSELSALNATIGGWSIDTDSIFKGTKGSDDTYTSTGGHITIGSGWISSKNFKISSAGNASFRGNIEATGGSFTGDVTAGGVTIGTGGINVTGTYGIRVNSALGIYVEGNGRLYGYDTSYHEFENVRTESTTGQVFTWYARNQNLGEGAITGVAASSGNWSFWGNGKVGGASYPGTSDRRTKSEIKNLDSKFGIEFIKKLNPVEFKFNDDLEHKKFGFIAQEVTSSIADYGMNISNSSLVDGDPTNSEAILHLNYMELVAPLVKSVQQLSAKIEQLEARLSGSV